MKKIIVAAAVAFAGVAAHASALNWGIMSGTSVDATKFASGTAYFIANSDLDRPTLTSTGDTAYNWYKANINTVKSKALFTGTVTDGKFYAAAVDNTLARNRQGYWMLIDNGEAADEDHFFAVATRLVSVVFNANSTMAVTATWNGGTQFGVFNVPEPTSGLMLLLGMAGLALRRRRA